MKTKRGHHVTKRRTAPRAVDMRPLGALPGRHKGCGERMKHAPPQVLENRLNLDGIDFVDGIDGSELNL